jgi:hypothetical protein
MDLREVGWWAWTGSIWLRIGTGGGLLWMRLWTFGSHKMRGISWVAQDVLASQEGLCSMEWVSKYVFIPLLLSERKVLMPIPYVLWKCLETWAKDCSSCPSRLPHGFPSYQRAMALRLWALECICLIKGNSGRLHA